LIPAAAEPPNPKPSAAPSPKRKPVTKREQKISARVGLVSESGNAEKRKAAPLPSPAATRDAAKALGQLQSRRLAKEEALRLEKEQIDYLSSMCTIPLSRAARRWQEIINDPELSQRPERIETDIHGRVIMAPPPDFIHRSQAKEIQAQLDRLSGQARAFTEQPIETAIGAVKIADVVWLTQEQCQLLLEDPNLPLKPAPPICVGIVSPSNTIAQMEEKRALYFATGAKEVWICERDGTMRFFNATGEIAHSHLVPEFPKVISVQRALAEERPAGAGRIQSRSKFPP
jgi:Uma2 family endonuclease